VPEEILDRDLARRIGSLAADLELGQLRKVARHRVGDLEASLLLQHHRRHAGDGFGHRVDAEERVGRHGEASVAVPVTEGLEVCDLALAGDEDHRAGQAARLDVLLCDPRQPGKALRREADVLGTLGPGKQVGPEAEPGSHEHEGRDREHDLRQHA
jgi:hypothetical protein